MIMTMFQGSAAPMSSAGFNQAQQYLEADAQSLWALIAVETSGFGFLPDRRPKILFERHVFHRRTGGKYGAAHPGVSASAAGGYLGGAAEYMRLEEAMSLDRQAAFESVSWGLGQIMGYHAVHLGYPSAEAMVADFREGEDAQLAGTQRFISANPPLRQAFSQKKWNRVAFFYNGAAYAKHAYDRKLEHFHDLYKLKGTPNITVRMAQAWLTYLNYQPRGIDGIFGAGTGTAVIAFQKDRGLPVTATLDDATLEQLRLAAASAVQTPSGGTGPH
jgi:hypothetical protein